MRHASYNRLLCLHHVLTRLYVSKPQQLGSKDNSSAALYTKKDV